MQMPIAERRNLFSAKTSSGKLSIIGFEVIWGFFFLLVQNLDLRRFPEISSFFESSFFGSLNFFLLKVALVYQIILYLSY